MIVIYLFNNFLNLSGIFNINKNIYEYNCVCVSLDEKKVNLLHINKLFLNLTLTIEKLNIYYNKNICKKMCKPFFRITEVFIEILVIRLIVYGIK